MIIAWVLSLLALLSILVIQVEHLVALELMSVNTVAQSHQGFMAAEKEILECKEHLSNITALSNSRCHIQSAGKNLWLISSTTKPSIEILVFMDEKMNSPTQINWRQNFE